MYAYTYIGFSCMCMGCFIALDVYWSYNIILKNNTYSFSTIGSQKISMYTSQPSSVTVYVHIYVHVYIYIHTYIHIIIYAYIHCKHIIYIYVYTYIQTHTYYSYRDFSPWLGAHAQKLWDHMHVSGIESMWIIWTKDLSTYKFYVKNKKPN